jgi:hypothetical protein
LPFRFASNILFGFKDAFFSFKTICGTKNQLSFKTKKMHAEIQGENVTEFERYKRNNLIKD